MEHPGRESSLLEAARTVARGGELDAKLDALAQQARTASGAAAVMIYLLDPVANSLLPAAQAGLDAAALEQSQRVSVDDQAELAARTARERRQLGPGEEQGSALMARYDHPAEGLIALPLVAADESGGEDGEGVLLAAFAQAPTPQSGVGETLTALADLCAVAIRNARLQHALLERSDWMDRLASTDTLTGLANRATLLRMLELEIARATRQGTRLSMVILDVDGFRQLNENAGADVGDEVLRMVASTLADQVRLVDTIGRLGPDEFGLIAPGGGGAVVARRVQDAAARIEAGGSPVSLSVGEAVMPEKDATAEGLIAATEAALARAKQRGRGQLVADSQG